LLAIFVDNHVLGGVDRFLNNLINGLDSQSISLVVITNDQNPSIAWINEKVGEDFTLITFSDYLITPRKLGYKIKIKWLTSTQIFLNRLFAFYYDNFNQNRKVKKFVSLVNLVETESLLLINGGYPGSVASLAFARCWKTRNPSCTVVMNVHNLVMRTNLLEGYFSRRIDSFYLPFVDRVVTVSQTCLNSIQERISKFPKIQSHVVFNRIAVVSKNSDGSAEMILSLIGEGRKVCLWAANYEPRKGHCFLIEMVRYLSALDPSVLLVFVGDDPDGYQQEVKSEVWLKKMDNFVLVGDYVSDVQSLLERSSVVTIGSQSHESFCYSMVEAFQQEVPVVATDVGAIPEIAQYGACAKLCPADDPEKFARLVFRLLSDPISANEQKVRARDRAQELSDITKMSFEYLNCIWG